MSSQSNLAIEQKVMEAARLLVEETAVSFTMDQLAAKAGVSRATIYRQLGGKKAILKRLADKHGLDDLEQQDVPSRILQAARTLFAQQGMMGPSMEQIAKEANVGVASVYRHFGDRTGLLLRFFQAYQPALPLNAGEVTGDLAKDLAQLVAALIKFIVENQDIVQHSFSNALEWRDEMIGLRPFHQRSLNRVARFLQAQIDAGQLRPTDPQKAAAALLGMILSFSLVIPIYYKTPNPEPQETAEFITKLFLDGLKQP
ncbi:TetR/AcrR family transcriptional regulator [Candidatus Leptofilum sp.]|uniref:TetR/AcrR family transcriptional regulator n=1 Tax=Candidatus Leptofilum sp. TaxID=3241576 RepID=UPI003B5AB2CD